MATYFWQQGKDLLKLNENEMLLVTNAWQKSRIPVSKQNDSNKNEICLRKSLKFKSASSPSAKPLAASVIQ